MELSAAAGGAQRDTSIEKYGGIVGEIKTGAWSATFYEEQLQPNGWLECDGSEVSKATYADLYTAIGDAWGTPAVATNFIIPDAREAVFGGRSGSWALGSFEGANTKDISHTHSTPAHQHAVADHDHTSPAHVHGMAHDHDGPSHTHGMSHSHNIDLAHSHNGETDDDATDTGGTGGAQFGGDSHSHNISSSLSASETTDSQTPSNTDSGGTGVTGGAEVVGTATPKPDTDSTTPANTGSKSGLLTATDGGSTSGSGGAAAQSVVQKTLVVRAIIKAR